MKVIIHRHGKSLELTASSPGVEDLVALCEEQLQAADGMLRLATTPALIQQIREEEVAVEIVYSRPATFTVSFNRQTLHPLRLLIPLTGDLAGAVTTIFHGKTQYEAGPYRNRKGTAEIVALVARLSG